MTNSQYSDCCKNLFYVHIFQSFRNHYAPIDAPYNHNLNNTYYLLECSEFLLGNLYRTEGSFSGISTDSTLPVDTALRVTRTTSASVDKVLYIITNLGQY